MDLDVSHYGHAFSCVCLCDYDAEEDEKYDMQKWVGLFVCFFQLSRFLISLKFSLIEVVISHHVHAFVCVYLCD